MNSSNPNTPQAESPKPSTNMLKGMTPDQQMAWFTQQAVDALNELAVKARAKEAETEANHLAADQMAEEVLEGFRQLAKQKAAPKAPHQAA